MNRSEQNWLWNLTITLLSISLLFAEEVAASDYFSSIGSEIVNDYRNFYSNDRLIRMGFGVLALGAIANTQFDANIQDWYQDELRSEGTDRFAKKAKLFGEAKYLIPISLLAGSFAYLDSDSAIGHWGINTARAYAVGGPVTLLMQNITGASRPGESDSDSEWKPFNDSNGVSGHAFIGAVPFLTLAKMNNENKLIKYSAYAASALSAWSRVNDNDHYTSQAIFGWYIAYESVNSVFDTNEAESKVSIQPIIGKDLFGVNISAKW